MNAPAIASILFSLPLLACPPQPGGTDTGTTADSSTTGPTCDPPAEPGAVWGPCNTKAGPGCPANSFCVELPDGSICAPACAVGCPEMPDCAPAGECDAAGICHLTCKADDECLAGQVCDAAGECVWP